ncbi:MAG: hypothetical protein H0U73_12910 [Tatlockia sp.]|nr:hypothetical protein [Tatlockia sp.]
MNNVPLEPRIKRFGASRKISETSIASFYGLDLLLSIEESHNCFPPECLTISLEVLGGFTAILGVAAVALAFSLLTGIATPVVFGLGTGLFLLGLFLLSTGIARHCDFKSILNDEPDYYPPPRNV